MTGDSGRSGSIHPRHSGESRNPQVPPLQPASIRKPTPVKHPAVYQLASRYRGTLYVGVTSDLVQRVWQHKQGLADGFTKQYGVHVLVWFEMHATMPDAIAHEKRIKEWKRAWKVELIEGANPRWRDLYETLLG